MHRLLLTGFILLSFACRSIVNAQGTDATIQGFPDTGKDTPPSRVRLPNGKLQQDEILKLEHNHELQEARQLVELSQALQKEIEQAGANVLSISSIHKTEEIEKLAKRIRSRIRGY
jgi:hypothetical protein